MNIAEINRVKTPALISQLNVRPVFDVNANVQGRDLYGVSNDIQKILEADRPPAWEPITVTLTGQIDTMRRSYSGLFGGMALAAAFGYGVAAQFGLWSPLMGACQPPPPATQPDRARRQSPLRRHLARARARTP